MNDELLFLLIFVTPAAGVILLLRYLPVWASRLAVWSSTVFALLMMWQFAAIIPLLAGTAAAFLLWTVMMVVTSLAVLGCLLFSRIRPWRQRCSKHLVHFLFAGAFSLLFLFFALALGNILPGLRFLLPFGIKVSAAALLLFTLVILWQAGVCGLAAHLDATQRKLIRKSPIFPAVQAPVKRRLTFSLKQRRWLMTAGVLLLLSPLSFIDLREPKDFPPEVQRELNDIQARLHNYDAELFPQEEMAVFIYEFTHSGDVNTRSDDWGWSMLHLACWFTKPALVEYLLEQEAETGIATASRHGWVESQPFSLAVNTALHSRTKEAQRIVELLLRHGADVNCRVAGNPLEDCVSHEHGEEMFLLLLEHGADISTASHAPYLWQTARNGWVKATRRLLELGAPQEDLGDYALHGAALGAGTPGTLECARLLLDAGADVNLRDETRTYNALMWLIAPQRQVPCKPSGAENIELMGQMVQLFLEAGASLDEPWRIAEEELQRLAGRKEGASERRRMGRTIASVLQEERPALAAWLEAHGVRLEK